MNKKNYYYFVKKGLKTSILFSSFQSEKHSK